tara:strand:+ start:4040 stop:5164 length:1125 start_codon:yes stop_codon:yes gene_type:complete
MTKDYYKTLKVDKNATKEQIKKAYKKLAMKYHPDRASEDKKKEYEEKFKEINEAAAVLGDEQKRTQYDQYGDPDAFKQASGFEGFQGFDFSDIMSKFRFDNSGSQGGFGDIFDQIFGGGGGRTRRRRGHDLQYELEITLEDAFHGAKKTIDLNKLEHCPECKGKGGKNFQRCTHCSGSGYLKKTQRTPFGYFQQTAPCHYCKGEGEVPNQTCSDCQGEGLVRKKKQIEVTIPAGVENNNRLRVSGEGEPGDKGGSSGDLYIFLYIKPHEVFKRIDNNIHLTIPISFTQACLGDEIKVPTLDGKVKLKIPPATQSETIFRMRDKGIPFLNHPGAGDQMVKVHIQVPRKLTRKQKELIKQLKEEKPSKSFFEKWFG